MERRPALITDVAGWTTNQPYEVQSTGKKICIRESHSPIVEGIQWVGNHIFVDENGGKHPSLVRREWGECPYGNYDIVVFNSPDLTGQGMWAVGGDAILADGTRYSGSAGLPLPPIAPPDQPGTDYGGPAADIKDSDGNVVQQYAGGLDTLGNTPISSVVGTNYILYSMSDGDGSISGDNSTHSVRVNFIDVPISTTYGITSEIFGPIREYSGTRKLVSSIVLPTGHSYFFTYDNFGNITHLTLPTGGDITYTWSTFSLEEGSYRYVSTRTVSDGTQSATWQIHQVQSTTDCTLQFVHSCKVTTVTDPEGNRTIYRSGYPSDNLYRVEYYAGSGNSPLKTIDVEYADYSVEENPIFVPSQITTTLENGLVAQTRYGYDQFSFTYWDCPPENNCELQSTPPVQKTIQTTRGNVKEIWEYDWGNGSPGPLLRHTVKHYLYESHPEYLLEGELQNVVHNINSKVDSESVYDGAGNLVARTDVTYDQYYSLASAGMVPQHDSNFGTTFTLRGNPTQIKRWRNTDGHLLATTYRYDETGNILSITDPGQHTTSWAYDDSDGPWVGALCSPVNARAFPTRLTNAKGHVLRFKRFPCTGKLASRTDANGATTTYSYDVLGRPLTVTYPPGGGWKTFDYHGDPAPPIATEHTGLGGNRASSKTTYFDGLGRPVSAVDDSDPSGPVRVDTTYDALGRKRTVTNPYRSSSDATYGITTYEYDMFGRVVSVTSPDGTVVRTDYIGNSTTVTDEVGNQRRSFSDALGRLTEVDEPGANQ